MKKLIVLSLGGSLIIPNEVDHKYIEKFRSVLRSLYKTHKFVVVTGGGATARKYIAPLKKEGKSPREQAAAGIAATRMNAKFMMQFFGPNEANDVLPLSMKTVSNNLKKNNVVFCGALRFAPKETTDGSGAKLANFLKTDFINLTNVSGLYTSNPKANKKAKFIKKISWKDFDSMTSKIKFQAGQHFVLDQSAAKLIYKNKIPTYIISGHDLKQLKKILKGKKFKGTLIEG
ncbi:UMP kinase [Candidatus Pacearchaeota archaeon]|nr:UMP kinase [Candidatus Pacearchaeota archaeon]|tara:strand:- start:1905 stop:2597 length:693 start_codon:yes stop_codon:yes gene_type:complete